MAVMLFGWPFVLLAFLLAQVAIAGLVFRFPPWPVVLLGCASILVVLRLTDRLTSAAVAAVAAVLVAVLLHKSIIGPNLLLSATLADDV